MFCCFAISSLLKSKENKILNFKASSMNEQSSTCSYYVFMNSGGHSFSFQILAFGYTSNVRSLIIFCLNHKSLHCQKCSVTHSLD